MHQDCSWSHWDICFHYRILFHCKDVSEFIYLPVRGHLGCCQLPVIKKSVTINICNQVFMCTYVFISFGQIPKSQTAGSHGKDMLTFPYKLNRQSISSLFIYIMTECAQVSGVHVLADEWFLWMFLVSLWSHAGLSRRTAVMNGCMEFSYGFSLQHLLMTVASSLLPSCFPGLFSHCLSARVLCIWVF